MEHPEKSSDGQELGNEAQQAVHRRRSGMCGTFLLRQSISKLPEAERLYWADQFGDDEKYCRPPGWVPGGVGSQTLE
jgi:hypothetical protein